MTDIHWNTWRKLIDARQTHTLLDIQDFVRRTDEQMQLIFIDCMPSNTSFASDLWCLLAPGRKDEDFIVALAAGEAMAMARLSYIPRGKGLDCEISYFGVRTDYRGQGLGNRLMQRVKRSAKEEGAHRLVADTAHQPAANISDILIFYGDHKFRSLDKLGPGGTTRVGLIL